MVFCNINIVDMPTRTSTEIIISPCILMMANQQREKTMDNTCMYVWKRKKKKERKEGLPIASH